MGGTKNAILLMHDLIETEMIGALPERIYRQLEVDNEGTALVISSRDFITVIAEVAVETATVIVRTRSSFANPDIAMFTGANASQAAGRYIAYLLEEDE